MEIKIITQEKDFMELDFIGEDHTLCNSLRNELVSKPEVSFASYNSRHPLVGSPIFALKVNKGDPKKVFLSAVDSLKDKTKELRFSLKKFS